MTRGAAPHLKKVAAFGDTLDIILKLLAKYFLMHSGVAYTENGQVRTYGTRPDVCICEFRVLNL